MSEEIELARRLAPTATAPERVSALLELVPAKVLSGAVGASPSALRNWSVGVNEPRLESRIVLDDLRMICLTLLVGARGVGPCLDPERVGEWLMSRDPQRFGGVRPVEMVPIDPMDVLAAAHDTLLELDDESEQPDADAPPDMVPTLC